MPLLLLNPALQQQLLLLLHPLWQARVVLSLLAAPIPGCHPLLVSAGVGERRALGELADEEGGSCLGALERREGELVLLAGSDKVPPPRGHGAETEGRVVLLQHGDGCIVVGVMQVGHEEPLLERHDPREHRRVRRLLLQLGCRALHRAERVLLRQVAGREDAGREVLQPGQVRAALVFGYEPGLLGSLQQPLVPLRHPQRRLQSHRRRSEREDVARLGGGRRDPEVDMAEALGAHELEVAMHDGGEEALAIRALVVAEERDGVEALDVDATSGGRRSIDPELVDVHTEEDHLRSSVHLLEREDALDAVGVAGSEAAACRQEGLRHDPHPHVLLGRRHAPCLLRQKHAQRRLRQVAREDARARGCPSLDSRRWQRKRSRSRSRSSRRALLLDRDGQRLQHRRPRMPTLHALASC
eukprot:549486-Hanusia_phi.AAC.3